MKNIMLKIIGKKVENDPLTHEDLSEDQIEFITEGRFYEKGNSMYLIYDERDFSGDEDSTTSLKITGDTIKMKRYGEDIGIETAIEFEKGKRFNTIYDTPMGPFEMEVLTNDIKNNILNKGEGSLDIDYDISLKGLSEGRNLLKIEIMQNGSRA